MTLKILVAEDNKANQMLMTDMLEILGHTATIGACGNEALSWFKSDVFDLVLMDCGMPGMDGFDATRALRSWEQEQGAAPTSVIALTGNIDPGIKQRCFEAGMNDYLAKPFTLNQLEKLLDRWAATG